MSFYSLMNKYKYSESGDDYTHVSMFPYGGDTKFLTRISKISTTNIIYKLELELSMEF